MNIEDLSSIYHARLIFGNGSLSHAQSVGQDDAFGAS